MDWGISLGESIFLKSSNFSLFKSQLYLFGYTSTYKNELTPKTDLSPIPAFVTRINSNLSSASSDFLEDTIASETFSFKTGSLSVPNN